MANNKKENNKGVWKKGDIDVVKIVYKGKVYDHVPTKEEKEKADKRKK